MAEQGLSELAKINLKDAEARAAIGQDTNKTDLPAQVVGTPGRDQERPLPPAELLERRNKARKRVANFLKAEGEH